MYRAAISRGREAGVYLDRIPDPEVRLLAEIEFIAALAGLPEISGMRMFRPLIGHADMSGQASGIRR
jgi:hypothetical protein